jgi:hypothetical protein
VASPQGTVLRAMIYADGDGAYQYVNDRLERLVDGVWVDFAPAR